MEMRFHTRDGEVKLQGINAAQAKLANSKAIHKALQQNNGRGTLLQISVVNMELEYIEELEWSNMQKEFPKVFRQPKGLPPAWKHDHRIRQWTG